VQNFDKNVGQRMESLPGFAGFKVVTNRMRQSRLKVIASRESSLFE